MVFCIQMHKHSCIRSEKPRREKKDWRGACKCKKISLVSSYVDGVPSSLQKKKRTHRIIDFQAQMWLKSLDLAVRKRMLFSWVLQTCKTWEPSTPAVPALPKYINMWQSLTNKNRALKTPFISKHTHIKRLSGPDFCPLLFGSVVSYLQWLKKTAVQT